MCESYVPSFHSIEGWARWVGVQTFVSHWSGLMRQTESDRFRSCPRDAANHHMMALPIDSLYYHRATAAALFVTETAELRSGRAESARAINSAINHVFTLSQKDHHQCSAAVKVFIERCTVVAARSVQSRMQCTTPQTVASQLKGGSTACRMSTGVHGSAH